MNKIGRGNENFALPNPKYKRFSTRVNSSSVESGHISIHKFLFVKVEFVQSKVLLNIANWS